MVSVGGRQPASVEEAVEGIRLGGRTVHLLVGFDFTIRIFNENVELEKQKLNHQVSRTEAAPDVIAGKSKSEQNEGQGWETTTTATSQDARQSWQTTTTNLPPPTTLSSPAQRPDLLSSRVSNQSLGSHHISGLPQAPPPRRSELPPVSPTSRVPKEQVKIKS